MLEGTDDSLGYFINIEVAAFTPEQASTLAAKRVQELGLKIARVEEISETSESSNADFPQILSISGKSYFPAEQ